jgi:archaellum component FlaF (FlaF/FlaG flagellin family)
VVEDWAEAYAELLEANPDWWGFKLAYLDEDDIPEVVVATEAYDRNAKNIMVYCYENGEAVPAMEAAVVYMDFEYIPRKNQIHLFFQKTGLLSMKEDTYASIQDGSLVELALLRRESNDVARVYVPDAFTDWDQEITEAEYDSLQAEYGSDNYVEVEFTEIDQNTSNQLRYDPDSFLDSVN